MGLETMLRVGSPITGEDILQLLRNHPGEGLSVEYKRETSKGVVETVAAMANTYGGLVVLGVDDKAMSDRIVGVCAATVEQLASMCLDRIEPPWVPDIVPVEVGDLTVLVVRVDSSVAPRPLVVGGKLWVRSPGRNVGADRYHPSSDERSCRFG